MKITKQTKPSEGIKIEFKTDDDKIIGRAWLFLIFNDLHEAPYGLMEDVFVNEEFRSGGYGTKLVEEIISLAQEKGCYKLVAQSRHSKPHIHEWYKKLGFKEHGLNFRMDF